MDGEEKRFYRTVVSDTWPLQLRKEEYKMEAMCVLRLFLVFCTSFQDPDRFLTRVNSVVLSKMAETVEMVEIWKKRLFTVGGGCLLGMGPVRMVVGDEVVCLEGVERPFVLRSVGKRVVEGRGEQECYRLVGYCYVDELKQEVMNWKEAREMFLV
ncbi:hypothetical protein VTI74DRAFT_7232 [Chaetomium olivicolor]